MSSLIPTVITDVNGKITTVHKRAAGLPTVKKGIPAPGMPLAPKYVVRQTLKDLKAIGFDLHDSQSGNQNLFHLAKHYPHLLAELTDRIQKSDIDERRLWKYLVGSTLLYNAGRSVSDRTPYEYRMWFTLLPAASTLFSSVRLPDPKVRDVFEIDRIKKFAQAIETIERNQGRFADDDGYLRVAAIMTVAEISKMATGSGNIDMEARSGDIDFISENWEAVTPLVPKLIEHKTTDRKFIEQLIESHSKTLNDGIL